MKKFLCVLLAVTMMFALLAGCTNDAADDAANDTTENNDDATTENNGDATTGDNEDAEVDADASDIMVGFIFLHDENSTYDKNFMDAAKAVQEKLNLTDDQVLFKTNIPEDSECYEVAAELVDAGCDLIFADSFGHEDFIIQAAEEFPEVQFCHATGTQAHTRGLANFHNAFASIYEGRYLAGIAAGMKINEMIENGEITEDQAKTGYVGAYP